MLTHTDKLDLRRGQKSIALSNLSINYIHYICSTWSDKFELPDGSYLISDIQDYFEHKHNENVDNPSIRKYVNKIENRIIFKIKNRFYLAFLTPETMKLLGSTENKITTDKNGKNVPYLEIAEVVLVHCNLVNNDYQQDLRILYTFVPNKPFDSLLKIPPKIISF